MALPAKTTFGLPENIVRWVRQTLMALAVTTEVLLSKIWFFQQFVMGNQRKILKGVGRRH